ncbi:hypothetical protein NF556_16095 [Ornithinimicrobium faecis]|uniref:Uncharacterized protein n=1 Tax=Ornithinimicrobium faecis TaxID=2934158 RepID=A0ABY4YQR8_9MICO|nr:hypothetical protein [Ornithinimicrobium sp. HY1793]USQ79123.1 hypothetical protein NF556_16095 [Ornithinimicrobium sp. HY1793]
MSDELTTRYTEAVTALGEVDLTSPTVAVTSLTRARDVVQSALDEAMAQAVTHEGTSVRQVAALAGIAPNSVSPRLARSATLSAYSRQGRVDAEGITLARADHHQDEPMRFVRRTTKGNNRD